MTFDSKKLLTTITDGLEQLSDGNFQFRLDDDTPSEFNNSIDSFNDLADLLESLQIELDKTKDYTQGILESSADIIITVFPSGKIRTFNTGAESALGYSRSQKIGQPFEELLVEAKDLQTINEKLKEGGNVVNFETKFKTDSGKVKNVLLTLSHLKNSSDGIIGTIGIGKDITEQKQLQIELIQSQRYAAIGQVFTGVQHSMKNMLNACKGGAYMVKIGFAKEDRELLEEGWEIVRDGITDLTEMSIGMLKYIREWKPKLKDVDLSEMLQDVYRLIKPTAKDSGIAFRLETLSEVPIVRCDNEMIHSAVMDIVSNAIDACLSKEYQNSEQPEVLLTAHSGMINSQFVIEIKDNGCGMSKEVKANIFAPFFSTKIKSGTGLGLSITSRMIDAHGGRFEVDSEPEIGTSFRIIIPIDGVN